MKFIYDQHVHAQFLPNDRIFIILLEGRESLQLHLKAFDGFLDLFCGARLLAFAFHLKQMLFEFLDLLHVEMFQGLA